MKKFSVPILVALVVVASLALTASLVKAGSPQTEAEGESPSAPTNVQNYIPVQGRLVDASGSPLNGDYTIAFRLYDLEIGGTALCSDTNGVSVDHGLFSTEIWGNCEDVIKGQQLYLGIEVGTDGEMTPRQPIYAVPYAWSLRPGAVIIGSIDSDAIVHIENSDPTGRGLRAYAMATTGANYGIVGASKSPDGYGGYFYDNYNGTGLWAKSSNVALLAEGDKVAIKAGGAGVIQSTAQSTLWVSGNGLRPYRQKDSTVIDMDVTGGALVSRGSVAGDKTVMLPITINGTLYGQNVKIVALDIYFKGETATDLISSLGLRRQTGTCNNGTTCAVSLVADSVDHVCADASHAQGCTIHYTITTNNILSATSGNLFLDMLLSFSSGTSYVEIGGVKLTLEHD